MSEPTSGKLAINLDTCTGCSLCVLACPVDVIRMDAATAKPVIAYPRDCQVCYLCEDDCPTAQHHSQPRHQQFTPLQHLRRVRPGHNAPEMSFGHSDVRVGTLALRLGDNVCASVRLCSEIW